MAFLIRSCLGFDSVDPTSLVAEMPFVRLNDCCSMLNVTVLDGEAERRLTVEDSLLTGVNYES